MAENQTNPGAKNRLRVAVIADQQSLQNCAASLRHLFVGLVDKSFASALICPPNANADPVLCPTVELIRHPLIRIPLFWLQNRRALLNSLEKFKPTILHCLGPAKHRLTRHLADRMDIPYVITFNSLSANFLKSIVSTRHCASLIASSGTIAKALAKTYKHLRHRIEQINPGTFIDQAPTCFCNTGRITSMIVATRIDNVDDFVPLLNAARHLAIDGYEFILAVIGTGHAERNLYRTVKAMGLLQVVTVIPDIQPLRSVFTDADVFIQLRSNTDFNARLMEAMSTGMAVAACRDSTNDLLKEDKTAVFFDSQDELSIYACLQRLLDRHELAKQIASAGQSLLRENYTVSKMIDSLEQTYLTAQQWYKT